MTKNCRFETPCGMCELFERLCKEVCDKKNEVKPKTSPMDLVEIKPLTMGWEIRKIILTPQSLNNRQFCSVKIIINYTKFHKMTKLKLKMM